MKRMPGLLLLLSSTAALAQADALEPTSAPSPPARYSVWLTPLRPPMVFTGIHPLDLAVAGSIGADFTLGWQAFQVELSFHVAPGWGDADITEDVGLAGIGGSLSIGLKLGYTGENHLEGFFIAPKLLVGYATAAYGLSADNFRRRTTPTFKDQQVLDLQLGATVGYQWVVGKHLYLAVVLAAGVGATSAPLAVDDRFAYWAGPFLRTAGAPRVWTPSVHFDLSLLRLGFAW